MATRHERIEAKIEQLHPLLAMPFRRALLSAHTYWHMRIVESVLDEEIQKERDRLARD